MLRCHGGLGCCATCHVCQVVPTVPDPLPLPAQVLHALLQNLADAVVTYIKYQASIV